VPENAVHEDGQWPRLEQVYPDADEEKTYRKTDTPGVGPKVAESSYQQAETRDGRRGRVARPGDEVHGRRLREFTIPGKCHAAQPRGERALKTRLFPEGSVRRVTGLTLSGRNTYTGDHGFRNSRELGRYRRTSRGTRGSRGARSATFPGERIVEGLRIPPGTPTPMRRLVQGRLAPYFSSCRTRTLPKM
jgi:hypothetical protein